MRFSAITTKSRSIKLFYSFCCFSVNIWKWAVFCKNNKFHIWSAHFLFETRCFPKSRLILPCISFLLVKFPHADKICYIDFVKSVISTKWKQRYIACMSAEGAKNVSWPWLSPLQGWGSLTMSLTGKFVYMAHHFILLQLNPFDLRVDREGWWFEHSVS